MRNRKPGDGKKKKVETEEFELFRLVPNMKKADGKKTKKIWMKQNTEALSSILSSLLV